MENQFTFDSCVGLPNAKVWSQTSTFLVSNNSSVGLLISLKTLEEAELLDLAMIGLKIIDEIHNEVNTNIEKSSQEWKSYVAKLIDDVGLGVEVNIGVVVANTRETKIIRRGNVRVIVIRNGANITLLESGSEVAVIRGKIQNSDVLLMLTNSLSIKLGKQIDVLQLKLKIDEIVRQCEDSSGMASFIIDTNANIDVADKKPLIAKENNIYVGERKKSKIYPIIGMGLLGILLLIMGIGAWKRAMIRDDQLFQKTKTNVDSKKSVIEGLVKLDPLEARVQLDQLKLEVDEYKQQARGKYLTNIMEMRKGLDVFEEQIFKQIKVNLTTWIELGLLGLNKTPKQIVIGNQAVMYFETMDGLVGLSVADKSQVKIDAVGLTNYGDFVIDGQNIFTLGQDGIYGMLYAEGNEFKKMIDSDEAWQYPNRMVFFGSSLYVLDVGTGELSKYAINKNALISRKRWFGKGIVLDLSKIVDLVVDGDLWLLSSSGKLERYSRGVPIKWEIEGFVDTNNDVKFVDPVAVATNEKEVFVLERGKSRVLAFDKEGKYVRQYLNDEFATGKDLVVVDDKGYILTENEIKVFGL